MKILASIVAVAFLIVGTVIVAARLGAFESDLAEARARYGAAPSQFIEIDGTRIHYRDEGQGPILVLLHGSRGSLQQWDGWVHELGGRFRIIRFDSLAHGLTGADGRNDYGAERELFLMNGLLDRLHADHFYLAGTSSGATVAVRYAAAHPGRVDKLLLSTLPLRLPRGNSASSSAQAVYWLHDNVLGTEATDWYWRTFLRAILGNRQLATPQLVQRYRELNSLPGQQQRFRERIATWLRSGGADRDFVLASKVTVPTLIQWGEAGPVLPQQLFCDVAAAFTATPVRMIRYAGIGHMPILEDPIQTARDALAFIVDGSGGERCAAAARSDASRIAASLMASSG